MNMKIQNNNTHYKNNTHMPASFKSNSRTYKSNYPADSKMAGEPFKVKCFTFSMRGTIDWNYFPHVLDDKFKNKEKVNVYSLGCSDGSEAYSFAISFLEELRPDRAKKFLPILASDKDDVIIDFAQQGFWNLAEYESKSEKLKNYIKPHSEKMHIPDDEADIETKTYVVDDTLRKSVVFEKGLILDKLNSIEDDSNTVVLCKNVFLYMTLSEIAQVAKIAGEKLKKGSLFIIGESDTENLTQITGYLKKENFKVLDEGYIFEKQASRTKTIDYKA